MPTHGSDDPGIFDPEGIGGNAPDEPPECEDEAQRKQDCLDVGGIWIPASGVMSCNCLMDVEVPDDGGGGGVRGCV